MRFMMLLPCPAEPLEKLVSAPNKEVVLTMRKYNDEMEKAVVLVSAEGLHATSKGFRIKVSAVRRKENRDRRAFHGGQGSNCRLSGSFK